MNHSSLSLKKCLVIILALLVLFTTACSRKEYVEGELGGIPVRIPDNRLTWPVSFNGDPGDFTSNPMPKVRSKIISGFSIKPPIDLHIPELDINGIVVSAGGALRFSSFVSAYRIYEESDRYLAWLSDVPYEKAGHIYGLEIYRAKAGDVYKTRSSSLKMLYKHVINDRAISLIRCVDHENIREKRDGRYSCDHFFTLSPRYLAEVNISYVDDHLPQWKHIEDSIKREIFSYADFNKEGSK